MTEQPDILADMAAWASALEWSQLPTSVQERGSWSLTDSVATMVGGTATTAARIALDYAEHVTGSAPLVGRGHASSVDRAAFGNGVAASALDFDDGHYLAGAIHPGSIVTAALLATADESTSVADAVLALVVGYEVGLRAAAHLWPKHDGDHYHATGCAGALGAAAATAKLRGLDAGGIARSVMIAYPHAPMSTGAFPHVKESIGWGAATGAAAAELAAGGFMALPGGGTQSVLASIQSSPFAQTSAIDDPFVTSFGTRYEVMHSYFKSFAACRYTHAAGAGFATLLEENTLAPSDITRVRVSSHRLGSELDHPRPATLEQAQYSFQFVLACLALKGAAGADEISEANLDDPELLDFATKVTIERDDSLNDHYPARYPSRVDVTTTDGRTLSAVCIDAPGDPGTTFGFDAESLGVKWRSLMAPVIGDDASTSVIEDLASPDAKLHDTLAPVWAPTQDHAGR